jgi:hypothetical protein
MDGTLILMDSRHIENLMDVTTSRDGHNIVFQHPVALRSHLVYYIFCL